MNIFSAALREDILAPRRGAKDMLLSDIAHFMNLIYRSNAHDILFHPVNPLSYLSATLREDILAPR